MVNKKGQTFGMTILFGIIIFIFGMLIVNFLIPNVSDARTNLSCSDTSISNGTKLLCLFVDGTIVYYIWGIISLAGGLMLSKFT